MTELTIPGLPPGALNSHRSATGETAHCNTKGKNEKYKALEEQFCSSIIQKLTSAKRFSSSSGLPDLAAIQREIHLDGGLHFYRLTVEDVRLISPLPDRIDR